ncbi:MAG: hypothetical protein JST94_04220 [Bacteroidetes bacterium]|nr:hypothetical protein [Bacteroidota bacterium]MBS1641281.1 hypothetical protein [Bacteroidota bacterium]MBS1670645.1 hypothetical protein [Bacteroidota bacterium]
MKFLNLLFVSAIFCFFSFEKVFSQHTPDDIEKYVTRLKQSAANRGEETAFMSAGSAFLYGWDNYEIKKYVEASWKFEEAMKLKPDNAYAIYMYAICLIKQNDKYKTGQAQLFLQKAFELNASLRERYKKDFLGGVAPKQTVLPKSNVTTDLDVYIERMKYSKATGGEETRFLTPGYDIIGGIEYYEEGNYNSAQTKFELAVKADANNAFSNYMLAVSLIIQGKKNEAKIYLNKAFSLNLSLENRLTNDIAIATKKYAAYITQREKETFGNTKTKSTDKKETIGGILIFGNFTCTQTVYNGNYNSRAGASTFSNVYKGNFQLYANGTYRWLDNGSTGKYSYNATSGEIKWLSGYFFNTKPQATIFQPSSNVAQITINFSDSYRWECGCNKK